MAGNKYDESLDPVIQIWMKRQGIATILDLAILSGLNRMTVRNYLYGERAMPFVAAAKLAKALKVSMDELLLVYERIISQQGACATFEAQATLSGSLENHLISQRQGDSGSVIGSSASRFRAA